MDKKRANYELYETIYELDHWCIVESGREKKNVPPS